MGFFDGFVNVKIIQKYLEYEISFCNEIFENINDNFTSLLIVHRIKIHVFENESQGNLLYNTYFLNNWKHYLSDIVYICIHLEKISILVPYNVKEETNFLYGIR